jgi:hypothetical protein
MKILLLVSSDVSPYYSASLMQRGHQIIAHGSGAFENLTKAVCYSVTIRR